MGKERTHTQIGVDATHLRRVDLTVIANSNCAEVNTLAFQYPGNRALCDEPLVNSLRTYRTEIIGNFVCEHFLQTQAKQVRRVAAVGSCHDITPGTCRTARQAMTSSATIADTRSEGEISID